MLASLNNTAALRCVPSLVTSPSASPVRRPQVSRSQVKAPDPSGIFERAVHKCCEHHGWAQKYIFHYQGWILHPFPYK